MNAPLLLALRDELVAREWACFRFNFRGVGASEGEPSMGLDEVMDLRAAERAARARFEDLPYAVLGWSFGAAVALRFSAAQQEPAACVAIAPAVAERPGLTAGLPPARPGSHGLPVLVVVGTNDRETPPDRAREWARTADLDFVEVAGANHFFWAKYDELASTVADWLDRALANGARP